MGRKQRKHGPSMAETKYQRNQWRATTRSSEWALSCNGHALSSGPEEAKWWIRTGLSGLWLIRELSLFLPSALPTVKAWTFCSNNHWESRQDPWFTAGSRCMLCTAACTLFKSFCTHALYLITGKWIDNDGKHTLWSQKMHLVWNTWGQRRPLSIGEGDK